MNKTSITALMSAFEHTNFVHAVFKKINISIDH